jgi:type IV pilus assembly protein PilO
MALMPTTQRNQALAGLYGYYLWQPKRVALTELTTRLDSLEARNAAARTALAQGAVAALQAEAEQMTAQLDVMRQLVPTGNELPALLEQVSTAARREGLDISAVEPQPVVEGDQFDTYRYRIAVTGGYHALAEFLSSVGSLPRIVAPMNLALLPATNLNTTAARLRPAGSAALDSRFEIQTYVIRTAPPARGGRS